MILNDFKDAGSQTLHRFLAIALLLSEAMCSACQS